MAEANAVPIETARQQHRRWWHAFWERSWILADGTDDAGRVTRGYLLQRFATACAGRGAYPIKFNGSIFTMDWHKFARQDKQCRFPAFWEHGYDYVPDEDNGGNGQSALQLMLMQSEGRRILLLPAWPKDWGCRFKLHAPLQTTVTGTVRGGKIVSLRVDPPDRLRDVEVLRCDGQ